MTSVAERDLILDVLERRKGNGLREAAADMDRLADRTEKAGHALRGLGRDGDALGRSGRQGGKAFTDGFSSALGSLPSEVKGAAMLAAGGLGVAFAPMVGAMVAGAVVGGVGMGGIAGGLAAAAQDPMVKAAAQRAGNAVAAEWSRAGGAFVEPAIKALDTLEEAFRDLDLGESLAKVAPYVDDIADGVAGLVTNFMPGFNRALDAAGPALELIGDELPAIGTALGNMVGDIAESEGAMDGLRAILLLTEGALTATGKTVTFLSDAFHNMEVFAARATGVLEDIPVIGGYFGFLNDLAEEVTDTGPKLEQAWSPIPGRFNSTAVAADGTTRSLRFLKMSAEELAKAQRDATKAQQDWLASAKAVENQALGATNAKIGFEAAVDDLTASFRENGSTMDLNTEKGRANASALTTGIARAQALRDATYEQTGSLQAANEAFATAISRLQGVATKAGVSRKELERMAGDYFINIYETKTTSQIINDAISGRNNNQAKNRAAGGKVVPGQDYMINERAREVVRFPATGEVRDANLTPVGGGSGTQRIELVLSSDVLGQITRKFVHSKGGNVQVALGRP